jgi:phenylacetate-CoA ligase
LRGFITSSETLTAEQRQAVQDTFGCRIFDWYGSAERVSAIGTCEQGNYHILSDYGFTELVPQENGEYELVSTGFDNLLMPLIRYHIDDAIVPADPDYICPCGRSGFPVVEKMVGRTEDYLIRPDGRQVFMMSNITKSIVNILASQVRQESPDEVRILVVPASGSIINEQEVIDRAREFLGEEMRIKVEHVTNIPKTSNGKFRAVVRTI